MKFVIAPDKFKGSLDGFEFCDAVEEGLRQVIPKAKIIKLPLADGGDGTMEVIRYYLKGEKVSSTINDPLFRKISANYLFNSQEKIAYIEMAEASGLKLLKESEQNCMNTSSYGTGELIVDAIDKGAERIILGIGGSSTNDCGIGMAEALGYRFLDCAGNKVTPVGKNLSSITKINTHHLHPKLANVKFEVACDVNNPLYGKNGAAKIYAAQKGASKSEIEFLDLGLRHFSNLLKVEFSKDVQKEKGSGAAGGMGAAAITFLNANLISGIELVKRMADIDIHIKDADWVITGEGRLDRQTLAGKTMKGVVDSAKKMNIPVAAFCGIVDIPDKDYHQLGLRFSTSILLDIVPLEEAIKNSYQNLRFSVMNFANAIYQNEDKKLEG
ncbi:MULTISPECIES: glycerate kinase [Aquimarina]|uniref:Glycerate kinase n=1 Tax=Aquimarina algiphila TaxID=2047982 RepID=A0A554VQX5_9FLAO|nr:MULTISPECIES: glycerate kinase [Aquimarina]TSE11009.1 glycerate kinase [Aquimarina algiphila]